MGFELVNNQPVPVPVIPVTGADNGLSVSGTNVELGGNLVKSTNVALNGQLLYIGDIRSGLQFVPNVLTSLESSSVAGNSASIEVSLSTASIEAQNLTPASSSITVTSSGVGNAMIVNDGIQSIGLTDAADYSANKQANSYITPNFLALKGFILSSGYIGINQVNVGGQAFGVSGGSFFSGDITVTGTINASQLNTSAAAIQSFKPILASNLLNNVSPPTSSSAAGTAGQTAYDATYFYVCHAANAWNRFLRDPTF